MPGELPFVFEEIKVGEFCTRCIIQGFFERVTVPHLVIKVFGIPNQVDRFRAMWTVHFPDGTNEDFVMHTNLPVKEMIPIEFNPEDNTYSLNAVFDESSLE